MRKRKRSIPVVSPRKERKLIVDMTRMKKRNKRAIVQERRVHNREGQTTQEGMIPLEKVYIPVEIEE